MGSFFLARDDFPPKIKFKSRRRYRRRYRRGRYRWRWINRKVILKPNTSIRLYVRDRGMGVDLSSVKLKIDGKGVSWDYDPDRRCIEVLPHNKIWKKGKHLIKISVADRAGNKSKEESYNYHVK